MSPRSWKFRIDDINDALNKIFQYVQGLDYADWLKDQKTIDAVIRNLEIIGEAINRILREDPDFPIDNARRIVGLRNQIIHGYDSISDENIWAILTIHLPKLKTEIQKFLK